MVFFKGSFGPGSLIGATFWRNSTRVPFTAEWGGGENPRLWRGWELPLSYTPFRPRDSFGICLPQGFQGRLMAHFLVRIPGALISLNCQMVYFRPINFSANIYCQLDSSNWTWERSYFWVLNN